MLREELRLAIATIISYAAFQTIPLLLITLFSELLLEYAVIISMILAMLISAIPSSILLKNSNISFLPPLIGGLVSLLILMLLSSVQAISPDLTTLYLQPYYMIIVVIASGLSIALSKIYPKPAAKGVEEIKEVEVKEDVRTEEIVKKEEKPPERVEEEMAKIEEPPKPKFIKCPHCGRSIPSDSVFCPLCGGKIGEKREE